MRVWVCGCGYQCGCGCGKGGAAEDGRSRGRPAGLRLLENVIGDAAYLVVCDAQLLELYVAVGGHGPLAVVDDVDDGLLQGSGRGGVRERKDYAMRVV